MNYRIWLFFLISPLAIFNNALAKNVISSQPVADDQHKRADSPAQGPVAANNRFVRNPLRKASAATPDIDISIAFYQPGAISGFSVFIRDVKADAPEVFELTSDRITDIQANATAEGLTGTFSMVRLMYPGGRFKSIKLKDFLFDKTYSKYALDVVNGKLTAKKAS